MDATWLWTIYFWVAAVIFGGSAVLRVVLYIVKPGVVPLSNVALSLLIVPVLTAVWGYIHMRPYLWPWFWQVLFIIVAFENVRFFFTPKFHETVATIGPAKSWVLFGFVTVVSIPMFFAHATYAFGQSALWR